MICVFGFMISIPLYTSRNKLVKEDNEYLYYKEYKIWNSDSCIYKYHKPITYDGIVIKKDISSHFVGLVGKGGHWVYNYYTTVYYSNKKYTFSDSSIYDKYKENDKVIIIEKFYPEYSVAIK
jgi:hypothetical protein